KWGGIEVSRLGFGCMRLPLNADGAIDRETAAEMIDTAYKRGVNYFDTAFGYHNGESEIFTGEALRRYPRDSYYIATKLPMPRITSEAAVDDTFNEQLRKTGMDYFDFYLLHGLNGSRLEAIKNFKIYEKMQEKKKQGLIKRLGFSFHGDFEALCTLVDTYEWDFVQIQINYVDYVMTDAKALYDKLCEKDIPIIVMEPVRGGFLANPPEAVKKEMDAFEGGVVTPAGWAMRWCISMDNMPVILSGMSTMEQVAENLDTFDNVDGLTDAQAAFLDRCRDTIIGAKSIPCTGCRYCMDCPYGVDIPAVFSTYNEYMLFKNAFRAINNYAMITGRDAGADKCVACGACVPLCPQDIPIPDQMPEIHTLLSNLKL
ncbi:MAG: aldo/keto reductase, partial [Oscillospiraceae bacterium]|nr:aldo/keto reductase [Oscillospiraceae bacterium]